MLVHFCWYVQAVPCHRHLIGQTWVFNHFSPSVDHFPLKKQARRRVRVAQTSKTWLTKSKLELLSPPPTLNTSLPGRLTAEYLPSTIRFWLDFLIYRFVALTNLCASTFRVCAHFLFHPQTFHFSAEETAKVWFELQKPDICDTRTASIADFYLSVIRQEQETILRQVSLNPGLKCIVMSAYYQVGK